MGPSSNDPGTEAYLAGVIVHRNIYCAVQYHIFVIG